MNDVQQLTVKVRSIRSCMFFMRHNVFCMVMVQHFKYPVGQCTAELDSSLLRRNRMFIISIIIKGGRFINEIVNDLYERTKVNQEIPKVKVIFKLNVRNKVQIGTLILNFTNKCCYVPAPSECNRTP